MWISHTTLLCSSPIKSRCASEINSVFILYPPSFVFLLNLVNFQAAGVEIPICSLMPDLSSFHLLFSFLRECVKVFWRVPMITLKTLHSCSIVPMKFLCQSQRKMRCVKGHSRGLAISPSWEKLRY